MKAGKFKNFSDDSKDLQNFRNNKKSATNSIIIVK